MLCAFCKNNAANCSPRLCQNVVFHRNMKSSLAMAAFRDKNGVESIRYGRWSLGDQDGFNPSKYVKIPPGFEMGPIQRPSIPYNPQEAGGHVDDPYRFKAAPFLNTCIPLQNHGNSYLESENTNSSPLSLFANEIPGCSSQNPQVQNPVNEMASVNNRAPFSPLNTLNKLAPNGFFDKCGPFSGKLDEQYNLAPTSSNNYTLSANLLGEQDKLASTSSNNYPLSANLLNEQDKLISTSSNNYLLSANLLDKQDKVAPTSSNNYRPSANLMNEQDKLASTSSNNYPLSANLLNEQDKLISTRSNNYLLSANLLDKQDKGYDSDRRQIQHRDVSPDSNNWSQRKEERCFSKTTQCSEVMKANNINTFSNYDNLNPQQNDLNSGLDTVGFSNKELSRNIKGSESHISGLRSSSIRRLTEISVPIMGRAEHMNLKRQDNEKNQESQGHWMDLLCDPKVQTQKQNRCRSSCHRILNRNVPSAFYCNACNQIMSYFVPSTERKEEEEEITNPPMYPIEYYIRKMEIETLREPIATLNLNQSKYLRSSTLKTCGFCKTNSENINFYKSHPLKDNEGKVLCPVLRLLKCPYCYSSGDYAHTKKYCPLNPARHEKVPTMRRLASGALASSAHHK